MKGLRIAGGLAIILMLAGCAGQQMSFGDLVGDGSEAPPVAKIDMEGRWKLTQPGAPSCGMNFGGGPGIDAGPIEPEGGCPDQFFTARHWEMDKNGQHLTIDDFQMNVLAQLKFVNGRFTGTSNAGRLVTLSRYPASPIAGSSWQNSSSTASRNPATPTAPR